MTSETKICRNCFARDHEIPDCTDKWDLFLPKLDNVLLPRFLTLFDSIEKYSIAFTSQKALNLIMPTLKPLRAMKNITPASPVYCPPVDYSNDSFWIVINGSITTELGSPQKFNESFCAAIRSKQIFNKARNISIKNVTVRYQDLLLLLSPSTKSIVFDQVKLDRGFTLKLVIQNAPNLQSLTINNTAIILDDSWAEELLNLKIGTDFRMLNASTSMCAFDVDALYKFMAEKAEKDVSITIKCHSMIKGLLDKKFSVMFIPYPKNKHDLPKLTLQYEPQVPAESYTLAKNI